MERWRRGARLARMFYAILAVVALVVAIAMPLLNAWLFRGT